MSIIAGLLHGLAAFIILENEDYNLTTRIVAAVGVFIGALILYLIGKGVI